MPDFFRDFLHQDIAAARRDAPPTVHLAAFGKHPAWNDHMEDIGLNTVTLLEAKRYIYLQGISGQIDTGAWPAASAPAPAPSTPASSSEISNLKSQIAAPPAAASPSSFSLQPSALQPSFDHWLLWHRPGEILLGRLLASSDGKGRTRYPFIVLAHIINLPLAAALETCAPLIDEAARTARAATTPDAVRQVISQTRARLADTAANAPDVPFPFSTETRPSADSAGWTRIYHVLENQLHQYGPGAKSEFPACRQLRMPPASPRPAQNLLWWATYWLTQLDPKLPLLFITPAASRWLDLIVGEPASTHFRCLLADNTAIPTVTDTPYAPSPQIVQVTNELLLGADANALPNRSLFRLKPPTRDIALATISTRAALANAARPSSLFNKLFG